MAYIGKIPAAAALTADDISDGIITNAKLAQDIISAETALTDAPADTDEFLISDAGTLKRIDSSLVGGGSLVHLQTQTAGSAPKAVSAEIISCASLAFVIIPSATSELVKGASVGFLPIKAILCYLHYGKCT